MAEISYFWHEITRFMATTVGRDERRRVHATARSAAPAGRKAGTPLPRSRGWRGSTRQGWLQDNDVGRSEEHTSELKSLMRISYAVFCLKKKTTNHKD